MIRRPPRSTLFPYTTLFRSPLARTRWTKLYLSPADQGLARAPVGRRGSVTYDGLGDGVTFLTPPLPRQTEITGDRKSTRLNSSHGYISYAVFCLKKKKKQDV